MRVVSCLSIGNASTLCSSHGQDAFLSFQILRAHSDSWQVASKHLLNQGILLVTSLFFFSLSSVFFFFFILSHFRVSHTMLSIIRTLHIHLNPYISIQLPSIRILWLRKLRNKDVGLIFTRSQAWAFISLIPEPHLLIMTVFGFKTTHQCGNGTATWTQEHCLLGCQRHH